MNDIKIGDKVVVINSEEQYTTYEDWAISNRLKNWKRGNSCLNGFSGIVTAISRHGHDPGKTLIAVYGNGLEIIINVEGVEKIKTINATKPIKKGMTEAVTRDGRKVTQLTWFEGVDYGGCVAGVVDGKINVWSEEGAYISSGYESKTDIFAPVEYEWQWLIVYSGGKNPHYATTVYAKNETEAMELYRDKWSIVSRIEESKREVQE